MLRDAKVANTRFHESALGKKGGMTAPFSLKLPTKRAMAMTAMVAPAANGRKPGPGSLHVPMSTVRAYPAENMPTIRKKIADIRSYWL